MNLGITCEPNEMVTSFSLADAVYRACTELYLDATVVAKMMLLEAERERKDGADND